MLPGRAPDICWAYHPPSTYTQRPWLAGSRRRAVGRVTYEQHQAQVAARARAEQQAAEEAAAKGAAAKSRAVRLQRALADKRLQNLLGDDEDVCGPDWQHESDTEDLSSGPHQRGGRSAGSARQPVQSHGERLLLLENRFRQHTEQGVQYRIMLSPQLAAAQEDELQQRVATVQRHVQAYVESGAPHPNCCASYPCVEVVSWRSVLLQGLSGIGVIQVPILRYV